MGLADVSRSAWWGVDEVEMCKIIALMINLCRTVLLSVMH